MTDEEHERHGDRTSSAMHDTAEDLEKVEDRLHRIAERSPDSATTTRLHALGDQVTAQAHEIEHRADALDHRDAPRLDGHPAPSAVGTGRAGR